jgi:hypothetical protein
MSLFGPKRTRRSASAAAANDPNGHRLLMFSELRFRSHCSRKVTDQEEVGVLNLPRFTADSARFVGGR